MYDIEAITLILRIPSTLEKCETITVHMNIGCIVVLNVPPKPHIALGTFFYNESCLTLNQKHEAMHAFPFTAIRRGIVMLTRLL